MLLGEKDDVFLKFFPHKRMQLSKYVVHVAKYAVQRATGRRFMAPSRGHCFLYVSARRRPSAAGRNISLFLMPQGPLLLLPWEDLPDTQQMQ